MAGELLITPRPRELELLAHDLGELLDAELDVEQVIAGAIALNGTPATAAFQTAAPPSERPKAPIWGEPVRACNQSKSSRTSWTSRGPSRPKVPPDAPVPRASQASEA